MPFDESPQRPRIVALFAVAAAGVVSLVGSGGGDVGALGFPPCSPDVCTPGPPPPPPIEVSIDPAYVTSLASGNVTFNARVTNYSGAITYQWRRWSSELAAYVDIAGATEPTYALYNVTLADDGATFQVQVGLNGGLTAESHLAVSTTPGVVFEDGEFTADDWVVGPTPPNLAEVEHSEAQVATGGHPGAFRKMLFKVPQGAGSASVIYMSPPATYDPGSQGAVYVIDYAEDCAALPSSQNTYSVSRMVLEQGGHRYVANNFNSCLLPSWNAVANRASLATQDFSLFDGPACRADESCPDFSADGLPMRFGYWRIGFGVQGDTIAHGIDNWKVTVWRR